MGQVTRDQALVTGAEGIQQAWRERFGSEIDNDQLITLGGQVWGESQFGRAVQSYRPIEWGSNNHGSIQATPGWQAAHAGDIGWGYILLGDVHADGTPYVYPYRLYPRPIDAARDWLALIVNYVSQAAMRSPVALATALKQHGYYEAPLSSYINMISGGAMLMRAALASGLDPEDVNAATGDDLPPNALDGKHLPGRVTRFGGDAPSTPPPAGPEGYRYIVALDPQATALAVKIAGQQDAAHPWKPLAVYNVPIDGVPWQFRCGPGPGHSVTTWKATGDAPAATDAPDPEPDAPPEMG